MDHFRSVDQNAFAAALEDMRSLASDRRGSLLCPKPLRFGARSENLGTSSCELEAFDSKARRDLLELFLLKEEEEDMEMEQTAAPEAAFFNGSPPSRANNPLTQDPRFREERLNPIITAQPLSNYSPSGLLSSSSPSSLFRKGGCARVKFGLKPATVRVEGFDCLNRDAQNSGIPAFA